MGRHQRGTVEYRALSKLIPDVTSIEDLRGRLRQQRRRIGQGADARLPSTLVIPNHV